MPNVVFCDSFDHYTPGDFQKKGYNVYSGGEISTIPGQGRNGSYACKAYYHNGPQLNIPIGPMNAGYAEFAMKVDSLGDINFFYFQYDGNAQLIFAITPTGAVAVKAGNGSVIAITSTPLIIVNTYFHIGVYCKVGNSDGAYELRVNGVTQLSATNVDTQNLSQNTFNQVQLYCGASSTHYFDDFILSSDGFCGDCFIKCRFPRINGTLTGVWTPSATSYSYAKGMGIRTGQITVTQNPAMIGGDPNLMVDGNYSSLVSFTGGIILNGSQYIRFDFGTPRRITESRAICWWEPNPTNNDIWKWQGSNDASSWTDIGPTFLCAHSSFPTKSVASKGVQFTTLRSNPTAYRYYQLVGVTGTTIDHSFLEFEFEIDTGGAALPQSFEMVDDRLFDHDDTYITTTTVGAMESYFYEPVGITGNIKAVQYTAGIRKDDAGARVVQLIGYKGGLYPRSFYTVPDGYIFHKEMYVTDPSSGAAWSAAGVDAFEFGVKYSS